MSDDLRQRRFSSRNRIRAIPSAAALLAAPALFRGSAFAQDKTTVRLTGWTSSTAEQDLFEQVLADFATANPEIEVKYEPIPTDYATKLQTDMAAGTVADVFYVDSSVAPDLMARAVAGTR